MPPPLTPWEFWRQTLNSPKRILAPMVDASELPWRLLSRKYGTELAYTPMMNAGIFIREPRYRREHLESCAEDRPLIAQFCANDTEIFLKAAKMAEQHCDAIDLNLGCPQSIAKKGHYGAFLQDEWDLISKMVKLIHRELSVPITCKVRVFEDIDKSIAYAKMLEESGCYALTVHGRTREQKGPLTGLASWKHIQAVKAAVNIPVIANGNIQYWSDVERCLESTGADAVMIAEGNLTNPALFANLQPLVWDMGKEYLDLVERYPCPMSYARGHLFKIFNHCLMLEECFHLRQALVDGTNLEDFKAVVVELEKHFTPYQQGLKPWTPPADHPSSRLPFPPWHCQPYVRPSPEEHKKKIQLIMADEAKRKREEEDNGQEKPEGVLSKNKLKKLAKLARNPKKQARLARQDLVMCNQCSNLPGVKCEHKLCRTCCRKKCETEKLTCEGHAGMTARRKEIRNGEQRDLTEVTNSSNDVSSDSIPV
ncbi:tRNA-dihydrouridine(16/17) synthase [NAD(P)(+)]-like [Daphnia magna]|uniref:tRNA-dihydrouridine(16/17) synthase [NAD(P)(+)]-like n=1 Tax=Daphnia magna TaxID=35525 RepID=UPI0006E01F99|nr:tRNA-dihydrouridine(16/17) synthase [NAD(P)(+)]-like [Daphnia magna]